MTLIDSRIIKKNYTVTSTYTLIHTFSISFRKNTAILTRKKSLTVKSKDKIGLKSEKEGKKSKGKKKMKMKMKGRQKSRWRWR